MNCFQIWLLTTNEQVKHLLSTALRGCAWAVTKGCRRAGKELLKGCSTMLDVAGEPHRLPQLLEAKGIPTDIDSIPVSSEEDEMPEPGFVEQHLMHVSQYFNIVLFIYNIIIS